MDSRHSCSVTMAQHCTIMQLCRILLLAYDVLFADSICSGLFVTRGILFVTDLANLCKSNTALLRIELDCRGDVINLDTSDPSLSMAFSPHYDMCALSMTNQLLSMSYLA